MTRNRRTIWTILLALTVLLMATVQYSFAEPDDAETDKYAEPPKLVAKSAILIDAATGDVLYEKKADAKRSPASCTKMLTALLAIENLDPDEIITVTEDAAGIEGSSVGLVAGEEIRAEDMIYAALLESGNDAATALAIAVDGSVDKFAERMNARAEELGLTQSHFANPHGLTDEEHYTTARNLAIIAAEAMRNERFREYVGTYEYVMPRTNLQPKRLLHNSNKLLYDGSRKVEVYGEKVALKYPGITGIKTGYTNDAGNCLVAGIERDGMELISVVLKSDSVENEYADTLGLLEYGLHNFETTTFAKKGDAMYERPVENSVQESMNLVLADDLVATVNKNSASDYYVDGEVTGATTGGSLVAPIKAGDVFGKAWVRTKDGQTLATVDLVAENSTAPKKSVAESVSDVVEDGVGALPLVLRVVALVVLIAVFIVVIALVRGALRRRRRRRNRMYGAKLKDSVDPREVRRVKTINRSKRGR